MHTIKHLLFFTLLLVMGSCTKNTEIVDIDVLPPAKILISGADEIMQIPGSNTVGRYTFDNEKMKVYIHLGIYRSGVANKEGFDVALSLDKDSVNNLISATGASNFSSFPDEMIQVPNKVEIAEGKIGEDFTVELDLSDASDYIGKILVAAIRVSNPSKFELSETMNTKLIYFDYMQFLGSPTFVDEFDSETFTRTYANVKGDIRYEMVGDPWNYYNDASRVLRATDEGAEFVYDINKIKNLLPFATAISGIKINALAPDVDINTLIRVDYSADNGQTFSELEETVIDAIFIPELGLASWVNYYIQSPLPTNVSTSHLKIVLLDQTGTGKPPWWPLLSRLEIFYTGGKSYQYEKP